MILQTAGNLLLSSDMCLDRAEEYFKRGLKAEPDNAILLKNMGWMKYKQGLYFEARRIFFESFLVSKYYMSELYVSEFFSQFGDIQAACGEWKMANALWSTSLDAGKSFLGREERLMLEFKIENSRKYFENNDNTENKERQ